MVSAPISCIANLRGSLKVVGTRIAKTLFDFSLNERPKYSTDSVVGQR